MKSYSIEREHGLLSKQQEANLKKELKRPSTGLWQFVTWSFQWGLISPKALEKDVPADARRLLESNVQDEVKHDLALGYITDAIGVDKKAEKKPSY